MAQAVNCGTLRTLDQTPPQVTVVEVQSPSKDRLQITLKVDEGARVWCAAWTTATKPTAFLNLATLDAATAESEVRFALNGGCEDAAGTACGYFWVVDDADIYDLESTDGVTSLATYNSQL